MWYLCIFIWINLIPKYEKWPDIQAALRKPADEDVNIQDTFQYLLKQDKFYEGTKWESHLFQVFPELEEYYDPMYNHNANLKLNIKNNEDILWHLTNYKHSLKKT